MTDEDVAAAERNDGRPFPVHTPGRRRLPGEAGRLRPRRLRPLLQHHRQPDAVVHPALPVGSVQRARHPPQRDRGVRVRLQRGQRGPGAGGAGGDRGDRAAGGDGPRLPPVHAAGADPAGAPGRVPAPLRPHPVEPVGLLAGAAVGDPRGALPRDPLQRHHRLPHPLLPAQLPAVLRGPARAATSTTRPGSSEHDGREVWVRAYPLPIDPERDPGGRAARAVARVRGRAAAAPARPPDPARRPRRPVQERAARLQRLRRVPRAAPGVPRDRSRSSPS